MTRLIMHGIPYEIANTASYADLLVLWQIVQDDEKDAMDMNAYATSRGVWGDKGG